MKSCCSVFILGSLLCCTADAKVLLITHSYNQPEFIRWQHAAFKKFLLDEYEYVVFNDAFDTQMQQRIEAVCAELQVPCYPIPQEIHEQGHSTPPNYRHCDGIQYALYERGWEHEGIVAIIDSDLFLIRLFSIEEYLSGYDIAGPCLWGGYRDWVHQVAAEHLGYLWPVLAFLDMRTLPYKEDLSFYPGYIEGFALDTGSESYYYFETYPDVRIRMMRGQLDVNRIGCTDPFVFNPNDPEQCPVDTTLYRAITRHQEIIEWGRTPVSAKTLAQQISDKAALVLALSGCVDIQFFEHFTFLHYGRGSLYHGGRDEHAHKALQIKTFLTRIGVL